MKALKILAVVFVVALMFTACTNDTGNSSSISNSTPMASTPSRTPSSTSPSSTASLPSSAANSPADGDASSSLAPALSTDYGAFAALSAEEQNWGQGVRFNELNQPEASVIFQERYGKYNAYFIGETEKKIYLTFDEGYENGMTAEILDILKEKNVKATFFVTGDYVKSQPELVRRMIDEGHAGGNHSWSHPYMARQPLSEVANDVWQLHEYVKENFNYEMTVFRYPSGNFTEQTLALLDSMNYKTLFWSYAYRDWEVDNQPDVEESFQKACERTHDGAIYLLHAVSETNVAFLPDLIDYWQQQGYELALF